MTPTAVSHIRPERPADLASIRAVNVAAFDTSTEADLVDALRDRASPIVSLVAECAGTIVGHIMFSPVLLVDCQGDHQGDHQELTIAGLAPMAVSPSLQRQGIGSALVRAGLEACDASGFSAVVVLGHAEYYPRFGFVPASHFGIRCEYEVPDDVFMAMELVSGSLVGKSGTVRYHAAFASV